jgi:hypothetical protein
MNERFMARSAAAWVVVLLSACGSRTEFFPLLQFAQEGGCTEPKRPDAYGFRREPIVVANPPSGRDALKKVVEAYDRRTLTEEQLRAKCSYERTFYRETKETPRSYVEANNGYFDHDRFEDHYKDIILEVVWNGGHDSATYTFYEGGERVK